MIKDDNFIHISGWMINELNLKGNDLLIYAVIHGFSQDGRSDYHGGLGYLAEWTNSTKQGVLKNLKSLREKGLIIKIVEERPDGTHLCHYLTSKSRETGSEEIKQQCPAEDHSTKFNTIQKESVKQSLIDRSTEFNGGIKQSLPNKNSLNKFKTLSYESENEIPENKKPEETGKTENLPEKANYPENLDEKANQTERQKQISEILKKLFGNTGLFSDNFIPNLSELCGKRQLEANEYISWTHKHLQKKPVSNFPGYFFKTILSETNISVFQFEKTQEKQKHDNDSEKKIAPKTKCKCCGAEHLLYGDCPVCGLQYNERENPEKISFHRKIYELPNDKKSSMNKEIIEMLKKSHISAWTTEKAKIYKKYGVI